MLAQFRTWIGASVDEVCLKEKFLENDFILKIKETIVTTISAQTILRSRHSQRPDKILSTILLRYPRFIHAEMMTHRQFSRNAASSRAIPIKKLIQDVMDNPAVPLHWGKNQPGMQANATTDTKVPWYSMPLDHWIHLSNEEAWLKARDSAVMMAESFAEAGYHKQIANRLLEPFAHITVLVSATEWSNFLALRDHPDAEPHIAMLAREVRKELNREDNIQDLVAGQWHLPFVTEGSWDAILMEMVSQGVTGDCSAMTLDYAIKKSVACCASTSYKTVDGFDMTMEKAIELHDRLVGATPLHASPAEHVAQADEWRFHPNKMYWETPEQHANFEGFKQYRKTLPGECL